MIVFITICIFYQRSIVLAVFVIFIVIIIQLGIIIVKRPRTITWMGRYIRNKLLLSLNKGPNSNGPASLTQEPSPCDIKQ